MNALSRFHKVILGSVITAVLFGCFNLSLAAIPLAMFILLTLTASFVHTLNLFVPAISRSRSGKRMVALTFDDGPDPQSTPALLKLLKRYPVHATFFVIGERAAAHPELIREILQHGHTIGNHGYHHDAMVAFKGARKVVAEITTTQELLTELGVVPLVFRPPVGITYPTMGTALSRLNMTAVTFSCRAWDRGNRTIDSLSERILKRVRSGDIVMLHDCLPPQRKSLTKWLDEVASILNGIEEKGLVVRPLAEVIGRPVDRRIVDRNRVSENACGTA